MEGVERVRLASRFSLFAARFPLLIPPLKRGLGGLKSPYSAFNDSVKCAAKFVVLVTVKVPEVIADG